MSRAWDSGFLAALDDPAVCCVRFVELQFGTGTLWVHDDLGSITGNDADGVSRTWSGVGTAGQIGEIEETDKLEQPADIRLMLSGLDTAVLDEALNQNFMERVARLYVSARNVVTGAMIAGPQLLVSGSINGMNTIREADSLTVEALIISRYAEMRRAALKWFTDAQLQQDHPGDLFFQYLEQLQEVKVIWGDKHATLNYGAASTTISGAGALSNSQIRSFLGGIV